MTKQVCTECLKQFEAHARNRRLVHPDVCAGCRKDLKQEEKLQAIVQRETAGDDPTVYVPLRNGMWYFDEY